MIFAVAGAAAWGHEVERIRDLVLGTGQEGHDTDVMERLDRLADLSRSSATAPGGSTR